MIANARSILFVPGDCPVRFDKAVATGADCVVLDLEDAVLADAKETAREAIRTWLDAGGKAAVRLNGSDTVWYQDDLSLVRHPNLAAVILPKAAEEAQVAALCAKLPAETPLCALIETADGILNARAIACVRGVARLLFGSVDFQNETGIESDQEGLLHARSSLVLASASAGLAGPVDGVTLALDAPEQLAADCFRARQLGMGGKLCIHPKQVECVNNGFSPNTHDIDQAERIVAAANASGARGALQLDGKLIDKPVVDRARRLLETVEARKK